MLSLKALAGVVSDHVPLLLISTNEQTNKRPFKMELFWLSHRESTQIIRDTWIEGRNGTEGNINDKIQKFQRYCHHVHNRLRSWHCQNFSDIEKQLQMCTNTILFFDKIEERRILGVHERRFKIMVKERAYNLSCILESRWHHRARCKWLQAGDKNMRFFHAIASADHRTDSHWGLPNPNRQSLGIAKSELCSRSTWKIFLGLITLLLVSIQKCSTLLILISHLSRNRFLY